MRLRQLRFATLLGSAINLAPGVLVWAGLQTAYLTISTDTSRGRIALPTLLGGDGTTRRAARVQSHSS
jgi:hypothetical protein